MRNAFVKNARVCIFTALVSYNARGPHEILWPLEQSVTNSGITTQPKCRKQTEQNETLYVVLSVFAIELLCHHLQVN